MSRRARANDRRRLSDTHRAKLRARRMERLKRAAATDPNTHPVTVLRLERDWTLDELAAYALTSRATIKRLAAGVPISELSLRRIARALGVPVEVLTA